MDPEIQHRFSVLQKNRERLLSRLEKYKEEELIRSLNGGWSVSQVFFHLNTAEKLSIQYVKKKMLGGDSLPSPGVVQEFKLRLAEWRFRSGKKFKSPPVLGTVPEVVIYKEVLESWTATRVDMEQILDGFPSGMLRKSVFKQPALGYLNVIQMLRFMTMHADKHYRQIEKALS
ncbi:MAG: DinB family protein [Bacteroidia bacterium]|nr:DinB family protein [Bacteroidia bacterium]